MGTEFLEVVCDEHGIGGDGESCCGDDAQLDRINVFTTRPRTASTFPTLCSWTSSSA
jgi:hypothetical protein